MLMGTETPLREYSDSDSDPLVFLSCGHVVTMSSMDLFMELEVAQHQETVPDSNQSVTVTRGAYTRNASTGEWDTPSALQAQDPKMRSCPQCRVPLGLLLRYGRVVNHATSHNNERRRTLQLNTMLQQGNGHMEEAERVLKELEEAKDTKSAAGTAHQQQQAVLQQRSRLIESLTAAEREANSILRQGKRAPAVAVYESTISSLARVAEEQEWDAARLEAHKALLSRPSPDMAAVCRAHIMMCRASTLRLTDAHLRLAESVPQLRAGIQRSRQRGQAVEGPGAKQRSRNQSSFTSRSWQEAHQQLEGVKRSFEKGRSSIRGAQDMAVSNTLLTAEVDVLMADSALQAEYARVLRHSREFVYCALHEPPATETERTEKSIANKQQQSLQLARKRAERAQQLAGERGLKGKLESIVGYLESLTRLEASLEGMTAGEMRAVLHAFGTANMGDMGNNPASRMYVCPNGHPYFVGNCGHMVGSGRCPECGAAIGAAGGYNTMAANNRQAPAELRQMAPGML